MSKNLKGTLFLELFSLLAVILSVMIYGFSFMRKITVFNQLRHNIPVGEIRGRHKVGQTFLSEYNGLSGVEVLLATYNRENRGELIFHLKQAVDSPQDIIHYGVDISKIQDNHYFFFSFPRIKHSKDKSFYFFLEAPHSQPGNAVTVWSHTVDSYKKGKKIVGGVASEGDLAFKTIYRSGLRDSLATFLEKLTRFKPFPLNQKSFYAILILLFILGGSLFLTILINYFFRERDHLSK